LKNPFRCADERGQLSQVWPPLFTSPPTRHFWIEAIAHESIQKRGVPVHHSTRIWAIAVHCLEQLQAWLAAAVVVGQISRFAA
jgi:hypothetical protein